MASQNKYIDKLAGKTILIIGGTSGLGFGVAEAMVEHRVSNLFLSSSSQEKVSSAVARLRSAYPNSQTAIVGLACDLSDEAALESNIKQLFEKINKPIDHIVYTAGDRLAASPIAEVTVESFRRAGTIRFVAPYFVAKHGSKYITPGPESSITITSGAISEKPRPSWSVIASYAAGLHGMVRGLALDLKPVRVNLISPGSVATELWDTSLTPEQKAAMQEETGKILLTGRIGQVEHVVESYLWVLKDQNVTGTVRRQREPLPYEILYGIAEAAGKSNQSSNPEYREFLRSLRFTSQAFRASKSIRRALFGKLCLYATQHSLRRLENNWEALLRVASSVQEVKFGISKYVYSIAPATFTIILGEQQGYHRVRMWGDGRIDCQKTALGERVDINSISSVCYTEYQRRASIDFFEARQKMQALWTELLPYLTRLTKVNIEFWGCGRSYQYALPNGVTLTSDFNEPDSVSQFIFWRYAVPSCTMLIIAVVNSLGASKKRGITELSLQLETMIYIRDETRIPNWEQVDLSSLTKFRLYRAEWRDFEQVISIADHEQHHRWDAYSARGRVNCAGDILPVILGKAQSSLREVTLEGHRVAVEGFSPLSLHMLDQLRFPRLVSLTLAGVAIPHVEFRRLLSDMPRLRQLYIEDCTTHESLRRESQNWKGIFDSIRNHGSGLRLELLGEYFCDDDEEGDIMLSVDTGNPHMLSGEYSAPERSLILYLLRQGEWDDALEHAYPQR
ncbi:hypothetical protein PV10_00558 [Exophiala mesophila]|uniref:Uncharacterized protein n=1 Tax=Exophiala mesophila TaxID=212818 RepID=A0A0D1ZQ38_EXOME|nr:uncharacterized protein PV10_00558 [Exophiala mesophila]KIV96732.1 hypothetical protein PV10_00558 [Exophiala mesophila]